MCDHHRKMSGSDYGVVCLDCHADLAPPKPEPVEDVPAEAVQLVPLTDTQRRYLHGLVSRDRTSEHANGNPLWVAHVQKLLEG
jgi:arginase family enzyme